MGSNYSTESNSNIYAKFQELNRLTLLEDLNAERIDNCYVIRDAVIEKLEKMYVDAISGGKVLKTKIRFIGHRRTFWFLGTFHECTVGSKVDIEYRYFANDWVNMTYIEIPFDKADMVVELFIQSWVYRITPLLSNEEKKND